MFLFLKKFEFLLSYFTHVKTIGKKNFPKAKKNYFIWQNYENFRHRANVEKQCENYNFNDGGTLPLLDNKRKRNILKDKSRK